MKIMLPEALRNVEKCRHLSLQDWDILIPQARSCGLLASLALLLQERDMLQEVPYQVRRHLESALCVAKKQSQSLSYELRWLKRAFGEADIPLVLLKGAAYITAGIPAGQGRLISDIDLLVPKSQLLLAEDSLTKAGWSPGIKSAYDEYYYRKWMHEIPPMAHQHRESTLDVHHTLLPPTTGSQLDPEKLFRSLRPVGEGVFVLSPVDMVLHSAAHLFHEGEFHNGMRDLFDLNRLVRHFADTEQGFWAALVARAFELDLARSLYYAIRFMRHYFDTPVPADAVTDIGAAAPRLPRVMDYLFKRGLAPRHPSCTLPLTSIGHQILYLRSHYLRMPLYLLLPHLIIKAWMTRVRIPELKMTKSDETAP